MIAEAPLVGARFPRPLWSVSLILESTIVVSNQFPLAVSHQ